MLPKHQPFEQLPRPGFRPSFFTWSNQHLHVSERLDLHLRCIPCTLRPSGRQSSYSCIQCCGCKRIADSLAGSSAWQTPEERWAYLMQYDMSYGRLEFRVGVAQYHIYVGCQASHLSNFVWLIFFLGPMESMSICEHGDTADFGVDSSVAENVTGGMR